MKTENKEFKCCICGKKFVGFGNNPFPLCHRDDYESRCCDECDNKVMQARIMAMQDKTLTAEDLQKYFLGDVCKNGKN